MIVSEVDPRVGDRHRLRSEYVERYYTQQIGPTAMLLAREIDRRLLCTEDRIIELNPMALAAQFGVSLTVFERSLNRLIMFGWMALGLRGYEMRSWFPDLTPVQVEKLHPDLQLSHKILLASRGGRVCVDARAAL